MEGLETLLSDLTRVERDIKSVKDDAVKEGGKVMQDETKRLARKRTGNLIEHIELSEVENGEIHVYVDNQGKAYYGHMLEFGTSKMSAKPYMGPAFNRSRLKINQAMANKLRQYLR